MLSTFGILPGFPHGWTSRVGPNCLEGMKLLSPPLKPSKAVTDHPLQLFEKNGGGEGGVTGGDLNVRESIQIVIYELYSYQYHLKVNLLRQSPNPSFPNPGSLQAGWSPIFCYPHFLIFKILVSLFVSGWSLFNLYAKAFFAGSKIPPSDCVMATG